jgi:hypothetical protein
MNPRGRSGAVAGASAVAGDGAAPEAAPPPIAAIAVRHGCESFAALLCKH